MDGAEDDLVKATAVFLEVRSRLFGIAYRVLGTAAEAEDVVQETWLRWQNYDRSIVTDPAAFLATAATRIAINVAQSSRVRREAYVGPWLPEPIDTRADPTLGAETGEALAIAVMLLMEKLPATERAAYVLREAFDYPYSQIGEIIGFNEAGARQLVSRARKHLESSRKRRVVDPAKQRGLLDAFVAAARTGDLTRLEELFAADVVSYSDGGGNARASRFPVRGRETVAKFISAFANHFWSGVVVQPIVANGQQAVALLRDGETMAVLALSAGNHGIQEVFWMMNPEKLSRVPATALVEDDGEDAVRGPGSR